MCNPDGLYTVYASPDDIVMLICFSLSVIKNEKITTMGLGLCLNDRA
jgi:hypothetical protein